MSETDTLKVFLAAQSELRRYAARITGDSGAAEDLVQEAWLRFRATTSTRLLAEPKAYLFRIVKNLALDKQRRHRRESQIFASDATAATRVPSDQPSQHAAAQAKHEIAVLREAMAKLPQRTRRAFEMHRLEGMRLIDIAAELGISKSLAQELVIDGVEFCKKALRRRH